MITTLLGTYKQSDSASTGHWHETPLPEMSRPTVTPSTLSPCPAPSGSYCYFLIFYSFIYHWLCWVLVVAHSLISLRHAAAVLQLRCGGFSLQWLPLLGSTGSWAHRLQEMQHAGSAAVAHRLSGSMACGIFPNQGSNPCPLHWQADS